VSLCDYTCGKTAPSNHMRSLNYNMLILIILG
jgi:hypothetical protein